MCKDTKDKDQSDKDLNKERKPIMHIEIRHNSSDINLGG